MLKGANSLFVPY